MFGHVTSLVGLHVPGKCRDRSFKYEPRNGHALPFDPTVELVLGALDNLRGGELRDVGVPAEENSLWNQLPGFRGPRSGEEGTLKRCQDFYLKAKARIWP